MAAKSNKDVNTSDRAKALELLKASARKQWGNDIIIDQSNLPDYDVISYGSYKVDSASNIGGAVRGKITQIYGESGAGKSTFTTLLLISAQKTYPDEMVGYIDCEQAFNMDYAVKLGLDVCPSKFFLVQPDSANQALDMYLKFLKSNLFSLVALDSIPALVPEQDLEAEVGDHQVATLARMLSKEMRRIMNYAKQTNCAAILINQIRNGIGFGSPEKVLPGGQAVKFYPSVNVELKRKELIGKSDNWIGQVVQANFVKNRFGSPYKKAEFKLYYGEGIRKREEAVEVAADIGIITRGGAWYTFPLADGTTSRLQGMASVQEYYDLHPEDFDHLDSLVVKSFESKREAVVEQEEHPDEDEMDADE